MLKIDNQLKSSKQISKIYLLNPYKKIKSSDTCTDIN